MDYYKILGIEKNASVDEIKSAYRKKSKETHPDINKTQGAEEEFKKISEAYEVLIDPQKKQMYDSGFNPNSRGFQQDFFHDMFFRNNAPKSQSILVHVNLNIKEVLTGCQKDVSFRRREKCQKCNGQAGGTMPCHFCGGRGKILKTLSGFLQIAEDCPHCHASGHILKDVCTTCGGSGYGEEKEVNMTVNIPCGALQDYRLQIEGQGQPGVRNHINGDLVVHINVQSHPLFKILPQGNVELELFLPYKDFVLGNLIKIPSLEDKELAFNISPCTKCNTKLRLRQQGLPVGFGNHHIFGDIIIKLLVDIPDALTDEMVNMPNIDFTSKQRQEFLNYMEKLN